MPRFQHRLLLQRLVTVTLIITLILAQDLMPNGLFYNPLKDFIHYIVFTLTALWLLHEIQRWRAITLPTIILLIIILSAFGGLIEIIQPYFQRSQSWVDFFYDLAGATLGCIIFSLQFNKNNAGKYLAACILTVTALLPVSFGAYGFWLQQKQLPVLMDFEHPSLLPLIHWSNKPSPSVQKAPAGWTENTSQVGVLILTGKDWVNLGLRNLPQDWNGYKNLYLEIFSENKEVVPVGLRIIDSEHNWEYYDRFNLTIQLKPGFNPVRISVNDIKTAPRNRQINLEQIQEILIFSRPRADAPKLYIDNIRVEP